MAGKKISNTLIALSSTVILAVYAAGFERTAPAAARFAAQTEQRLTTMTTMPMPPGSYGQMPGTYQRPSAPPPLDPLPVVPPKAALDLMQSPVSAPVAASNPMPESPAPIEAVAPVSQPAPPPPVEEPAPVSEPAVAPPVEEPATVPGEASPEAPALVAELEPAPPPAATSAGMSASPSSQSSSPAYGLA